MQNVLIGGEQVGQSTLERFYALHVAVLPALVVVTICLHIWRVRKDGFAVERSAVGGTTGTFAEGATDRDSAPSLSGRTRRAGRPLWRANPGPRRRRP